MRMTSFQLQLARWQTADRLAREAERAVGTTLDAYCEGTGPAPSPKDVARVKALRAEARAALRRLLVGNARMRREVRVI
jgi:hypothetical protein